MSRSSTTAGTAPQAGKTTQSAPVANNSPMSVPLDKVALRAYQKWMQKGCKHGCDTQDWLEAEAELKAELAKAGQARR